MGRLIQSIILCVLLQAVIGCDDNNSYKQIQKRTADSGSVFPSVLNGKWKGEGTEWELVFTEDGQLSSAIIPSGRVTIRPNETTEMEGRKGEPGFFEVGDCTVEYQPDDRSVIIEINIERLYAEMAGGIIDGSYTYLINGQFKKDFKSWDAWIYSVPDLDVFMPDPNSDPNNPVYSKAGRFDVNLNDLDSAAKRVLFIRPEKK